MGRPSERSPLVPSDRTEPSLADPGGLAVTSAELWGDGWVLPGVQSGAAALLVQTQWLQGGSRPEGAWLPRGTTGNPGGSSCSPPTHGCLSDQESLPFSALPMLLPSVPSPCCWVVPEVSSSRPLLK